MGDEQELKKELAKRKRIATDIASQIHDIVEDRLMTDYKDLAPLSEQAIKAVEEFYSFKQTHGL